MFAFIYVDRAVGVKKMLKSANARCTLFEDMHFSSVKNTVYHTPPQKKNKKTKKQF